MNYYSIFGLNILSEIELPGLIINNFNSYDLKIIEGNVPDNLKNSYEYQGNFQYTDDEFLFKSKNSGKFLVKGNNEIIFERYPHSTYEDVKVLLLSVVIGIMLHKKEKFPLHASAVEYNGKTILFSGICGAGKSTLAAYFISKGATLISDDITVIEKMDEKFYAIPSFSHMKLWPDSLNHLGYNPTDFEKFRPRIEKRVMKLESMLEERIEMHSIYFLARNNTNILEIQELSVQEKISLLKFNTFRAQHLKRIGNNQKHFEICCDLTRNIPIKIINRPQDKFMLEETVKMIIEDINAY